MYDTAPKVIGQREILLLRELAACGIEARSVAQACRLAVLTLDRYAESVPFSLIYLVDAAANVARLEAAAGVGLVSDAAPATIPLDNLDARPWPLAAARGSERAVLLEELGSRHEPPHGAVIVPIRSATAHEAGGYLVAGVSPRRAFDDSYRGLYDLIAAQVASAIANVRAGEDERRRAAALAERDRDKIAFFSNISHEFREPLTLMLDPLAQAARGCDERTAALITTAHRNALRLLKLVNTMLEFSRIEAGTNEGPAVSHVGAADQYLAEVEPTIVRNPVDPPTLAPPLGGRRQRVLFADESADLRTYVTRVLAPYCEVVAVRDGSEALAAARAARFDLIVSDEMMPELDGFGLLAAVRADRALAGMPFIMLSARAGVRAALDSLSRGADDYLVKPFSADELLARVWSHLNAAAVRERSTDELRASEERFRMLAASMPHIVFEGDPDGSVTFLSQVWTTYTGLLAEDGHGSGWTAAIHPVDRARVTPAWEAAVVTGDAFREHFRLRRADGRYRWHLAHLLALQDASGAVVRWTGTVTDVDDALRAVHEREFLSEASRILAQSLDVQTTLQNIAQLTVPRFADWCQIDLRTPEGRIQTVAIAHRDERKHRLAQQLIGRVHLDPDADVGVAAVIKSGRSELIPDASPVIDAAVGDRAEAQLYRELGIVSAACVPLAAQGKTLGAIGVALDDAQRAFTADDLPMLEELGRRAGLAVHNAREFEREHRVAQSFQAASLPSGLPQLPGVRFDAVYVPADDEAQVGGDWYDAVRLFDGRVVISIGDVTGNGLHAAVMMGNMRQTIRGIAQVHADPALMLDAADRALRLEHPDRIVTAFVGVLDPIANTLAYASAGHPPPLLRHPDGRVDFLADGGLPLGLRNNGEKSRGTTIRVPPGAHVVFYTDGLTEYQRSPADGEARLQQIVADGSILGGAEPAHALKEAFLAGRTANDDVALLVVTFAGEQRAAAPPPHQQRWTLDAADGAAGQAIRAQIASGLRSRGASADSIYAAEVVFGELLGNAARHAHGDVDVLVDWSADAPVLHVLDHGTGFDHIPALPKNVFSESGRGLFLIAQLSDDFHVSRRFAGGSHARAVLARNRLAFDKSTC